MSKQIIYIGNKPTQKDVLYDSHIIWDGKGDIKEVDDELATKLLKHDDCYREATAAEVKAHKSGKDVVVEEITEEVADNTPDGNTDETDTVGDGEVTQETTEEVVEEVAETTLTKGEQIINAIKGLDDADKTLWTSTGLPRLEKLEEVLGFEVNSKERNAAIEVIDAEDVA